MVLIQNAPVWVHSDNGSEWTAKALRGWLAKNQSKTLYIHPSSPCKNAYIESFIGKTRDEILKS
ncbi:MAG: DDE-type integrase/transposase/recombinase [bacterium]|nr:DDE-type integrase/transposase/recombinase [bacterium]